jgi:Rps23 Pro-64 3,4-dihydroxylase Tpa1-like proline 4-hydroxylase
MPQLEEVVPGSFIYRCHDSLSGALCDEIIERFEQHPEEQHPGRIGQGQSRQEIVKKSVDLRISGKEHWRDVDTALFQSLREALSAIAAIHPFFASNSFKDIGYNLQRYEAGDYYRWHVDGGPGEFSQRQLVAIWYLNDVPGPGGETEFAFQNVKVQPRRGDLLLFPPFWTHVHRAVEPVVGRKYILTTWVCFA